MKKFILLISAAILAAVVAVAFPSPAPAADDTSGDGDLSQVDSERYPINEKFDKATTVKGQTGKYTSGIKFESPAWGTTEVTGVQDNSPSSLLYHNITDTQLKAAPGETVTATIVFNSGGMAGYAYIDLDNDGLFTFTAPTADNSTLQPGLELAAFTRFKVGDFWYHSDGTSNTDPNPSGNKVLTFKVPETPGTYKMRFNTEWSVIDPLGSNTIADNGGSIIDIDLVVASPTPVNYPRSFADDAQNRYQQINPGTTQPRYTNALTFSSPSMGASVVNLNQQANEKLYISLMSGTEGAFVAKAGETVSIDPTWSMNAMHSFVYVDLDGNGQFDVPATITDGTANGELLSYSYLDGTTKNSAGVAYPSTSAGAVEHRVAPAFTIPAGTAPGIYRLRFNIDWASCNPAGTASIGENGGLIADIPLLIVGDNEATVTTTGTATNGTATYESGNSLTLTPDYGYTVGTMTASASTPADITVVGPENPSSITFSKTLSGPTIPAALLSLGNVTVDVTNAFTPIDSYNGYSLIWNDEFNDPDGTHPDMEGKYQLPERYESAWNRFISAREDLMVMENGLLQMYCKPNTEPTEADDRDWVSGAIRTRSKFSFKYGRAEARMRVHGFDGSFPAFWLMPNNQPNGWPASGEIDIFESINNQNTAYATLHAAPSDGSDNRDFSTPGYQTSCTINEWHVYGVEWSENEIKFYIDGQFKGSTLTPKNANGGYWPFNDQEFYLILNQSVGNGGWVNKPVAGHTYQTDVDWVRVYQKTDGLAPSVTFVDETGAALAAQPTTITASGLTAKVTTNATATITSESETLTVTPGSNGQYTISIPEGYALTGKDDFTVKFTATYPAGNTETTEVKLSIPTSRVTWPKATADSDAYVDLKYLADGKALESTADESADKNSALVITGTTLRADYNILPLKADSHRIISYGQVGNLKTSYTKDGATVDLKTSATKSILVGYEITDDAEFAVEAEYMPLLSWTAPDGVTIAVTVNSRPATNGSRIFKGAAVRATFTPDTKNHYDIKSISGIGADLTKPTTATVTRNATAADLDITITATAEKHGHVVIHSSRYYTITVMNGDTKVVSDDFLPLGIEVTYTITPADGYMLTKVNGETLNEPSTDPITGTITVDASEIDITADVEVDVATADIDPDNIQDENIAQEEDLEEGEHIEDQPVHFHPAKDETDFHTLTFHHNSQVQTVTLPASLHEDSDHPNHEFVGVSDDENIAVGRIFLNNSGAWKLEITRQSHAGETLIHIYWREKAAAQTAALLSDDEATEPGAPVGDEIYEHPLATVRVKVITPPAATVAVSHEVEELDVELKPDDTIDLSAITAALLDENGDTFTDSEGNDVALPENYATKWVSDDESVAAISADEEGNTILTAVGKGNATVKAVIYDTNTGDIIEESEPINITVRGDAIIVGIDQINADAASGRTVIYDLSGRRITRLPAPGIYIIDGKKTLVR